MKFIAMTVIAVVAMVAPVVADARPTINLKRAERTVQTALDSERTEYNQYIAEEVPPTPEEIEVAQLEGYDIFPMPTMTLADLLGCDADGSFRVICDVEYIFSDGWFEENTLSVVINRRGKYIVR